MNRQMKQALEQAQRMQQGQVRIQEELAGARVEGSAGGLKATVTGQGELVGISIPPEALEGADPDLLEDMILAAVRDAVEKSRELQAAKMKDLGMPSLGGLL